MKVGDYIFALKADPFIARITHMEYDNISYRFEDYNHIGYVSKLSFDFMFEIWDGISPAVIFCLPSSKYYNGMTGFYYLKDGEASYIPGTLKGNNQKEFIEEMRRNKMKVFW